MCQKVIARSHVCSNEYNLYVNLLKTKVVIFRNRGNIKSEEKWYLNGESIEICNELSILFSKKINVMSQYPHLYGNLTLHSHITGWV
jgi:hypothetical protein